MGIRSSAVYRLARLLLVLVLYGIISSCTPAIPLSTPPENYKGPIAGRPVLHEGEYWVYKRGDLTKAKATTLTANIEFPLWVGRSWSYEGEALRRGQSQTSQAFRFPTKIDCYAAAFKEVVVAAGSFAAFECQCQCELRNPGRYEPGCGAWTIWYAPDVKNVIKIKAERTDRSMELESYKNLSAKPEVRSTDAGVKFTDSNVTIVTARFVEKGRGVTGITDTFTFEGKIFVHITTVPTLKSRPAESY